MRIAYVLLLAGLLAANAQQPPPTGQPAEPEANPEHRGTIEGIAVDAQTEAPLKKVELTLRRIGGAGPSAVSTHSDSSGRFIFRQVDPGRYSLAALRTGYAPHNYGRRPSPGSPGILSVAAKQHLKGVVLAMQPGALLTGRVVDEDGDPVAYARVTLVKPVYTRGGRILEPITGGDGTDDRGEFRIFGIPPGRYYIRASYRGMSYGAVPQPASADSGRGDTGYATVYYPGVVDSGQAAPINLKVGEERHGLDFRLIRVRTVRLCGWVLSGDTGRPASDVRLIIRKTGYTGMNASEMRSAPVDSGTGRFEVAGLLPGSYTLSGFRLQGTQRWFAHMVVETGDTDVMGLELRMRPGVDLKGVVRLEDGTNDMSQLEGVRVSLSPLEVGRSPNFAGGNDTVSAAGSFEIGSLAPVRFAVRMSRLPKGAYLKAATFGNEEALEEGFVVSRDSASGGLELVVSLDGGSVEGTVRDEDGKPVTNASVALVPQKEKRNRRDLFQLATTDQHGSYSIQRIPPGDYRLFAWETLEYGAHRDPEFLEPYEDDGVKLTVDEKSHQVVGLELLTEKDQ